jgi:predicted Zn-dependent protease
LRATALLFCLLVAGCTNLARTEPERTVSLPDPPARADASSEQALFQREHQRILAAYGGAYRNAALEGQMGEIVDRLTAASERPDLRYRVTILNSPAINAFALPTGQLYVTRGLVALANDRAELASVLAHEMAHVIARHAAIREDQARQAVLVSRVVNDVLNDPQAGAVTLARSRLALASFSRAQELEADGIGVGITARAGFDPFGSVRFLTTMGRFSNLRGAAARNNPAADFTATHPSTPERIRNALANARQHAGPNTLPAERDAFLASIDGLTFGDDPSEGYVRGRRFLHPRLGFTLEAPPDFVLENTPQALLGLKEGGVQALRLDSVPLPADRSLTDYMASGWIDNVDPGSVTALTINDLPAATALARGDQWTFRVYAIRFGAEVYRMIYAARTISPDMEREFRQSAQSFRRATPQEIASAQPMRLAVTRVQPGDTAERLATRMAFADRQVDRFLVLNGLEPGQGLKAGDTVKLIVD